MTEPEAVLGSLGPAAWSEEDGRAYEVALDGINQVVGAYSGLIAAAERAGEADRVRGLRQEQARWSAKRLDLTPADRQEVDAITAEAAGVLRGLRE
ncbi:hypothetical protein [Streptomyces sp. NPDC086023]|uniref:hypothetical protein n=1 Tax=Streptomyces sp. NPDC086023 TaxID=3365746 RepID=UPI0037D417C1